MAQHQSNSPSLVDRVAAVVYVAAVPHEFSTPSAENDLGNEGGVVSLAPDPVSQVGDGSGSGVFLRETVEEHVYNVVERADLAFRDLVLEGGRAERLPDLDHLGALAFALQNRQRPTRTKAEPQSAIEILHPESVLEGQSFTVNGVVAERCGPGRHLVEIDWGDGEITTVDTDRRGEFEATHVYHGPFFGTSASESRLPLLVSIEDARGQTEGAESSVRVISRVPEVHVGNDEVVTQGEMFTRRGWFVDYDLGPYRVQVEYGDGTPAAAVGHLDGTAFRLTHTFVREGAYTVTVSVRDSRGMIGRGRFRLRVVAPGAMGQEPPVAPLKAPSAARRSLASLIVVQTDAVGVVVGLPEENAGGPFVCHVVCAGREEAFAWQQEDAAEVPGSAGTLFVGTTGRFEVVTPVAYTRGRFARLIVLAVNRYRNPVSPVLQARVFTSELVWGRPGPGEMLGARGCLTSAFTNSGPLPPALPLAERVVGSEQRFVTFQDTGPRRPNDATIILPHANGPPLTLVLGLLPAGVNVPVRSKSSQETAVCDLVFASLYEAEEPGEDLLLAATAVATGRQYRRQKSRRPPGA